jgi:hypothetical protein
MTVHSAHPVRGELVLELPPSSAKATRGESGASTYRLYLENDRVTVVALEGGSEVMRIVFKGDAPKDGWKPSYPSPADQRNARITVESAAGHFTFSPAETEEYSLGRLRLASEEERLIGEAARHMSEVFRRVPPSTGFVTEELSDGQRKAMNTICYAAGIAAGFWPIGTLIAGPTAVGCAVMYATGNL